jgi:protein-arginine kinase activator protein McsA
MTKQNPSFNKVRTRRCFLCNRVYEETYGIPLSGEWGCGDCLLKISMKQLPKIIMEKRKENEHSS